ncbi:MAG: D-alanine--D-alanine ligase, partial [Clostridia bacterium]|nr:D-alanine--D-alanine ligase [Clostridia bacterium]
VLGDCDNAIPSVCEEPLNATDILTFNDKYTSGGGKSKGMSSTKRQLPALITEGQTARIQDLAVRAFKAIGLSGVCRIDFLLNDETGEIFINEPNTIPGSLSFYLWEASGVDFTQLMDKLIELALKKHREKAATVYSFNSNVLAAQGGSKGAKGKA